LAALSYNTTGNDNTANGFGALYRNATGSDNTATGYEALQDNNADNNTAIGFQTIYGNTTVSNNTAIGAKTLCYNNGSSNTANGVEALFYNTTGYGNTANGAFSLLPNTTGYDNAATGAFSLLNNATGHGNTANGFEALFRNATGNSNTANGHRALFNNTGNNNVAIGNSAGSNLTTGSNNIDIGVFGVAGEANTIRIGTLGTHTKAFVAGISVLAIGGTGVVVNSNGRLGLTSSSMRYKDEIKPMDNASEAILSLKPVTFRYKKEIDVERTPQFGLVAEDVEKVNRDLVVHDPDGKVYTVRYEAVNAMLLNEFLKEHKAFVEEHGTVEELKKQVGALTASLQKVSARLELSKAAPRSVLNNY
jgi:hypothetical protein